MFKEKHSKIDENFYNFCSTLMNECLEIHKIKDKNKWPIVDKKLILEEKIKLVSKLMAKQEMLLKLKKI